MRKYAKRKLMVKYRFKDSMGCVFFREFQSCREAMLWFERNKQAYCLKEIGNMGTVYPGKVSYVQ